MSEQMETQSMLFGKGLEKKKKQKNTPNFRKKNKTKNTQLQENTKYRFFELLKS